MTLEETIRQIRPLDEEAMERAWRHWDSIAKPLRSLGKLEKALVQIAGIQRDEKIRIEKKGLVIMCADNGVVEEGVASAPQSVTLSQTINFTRHYTGVSSMAEYFGIDPTLVRIIWLLFVLFGGCGLLAYLICWILMPNE